MKQTSGAKRGRKRRLSREEMASREKAIIEDIKQGELSYREIALKHDVSLPTVNNKARKAGISRGRRKGARIRVVGPARKSAARAARRPGRPRGRAAAGAAVAPVRRGPRKAARRGPGRPPGRPRASAGNFMEELRKLVLRHNPNISLVQFEELSRLVGAKLR